MRWLEVECLEGSIREEGIPAALSENAAGVRVVIVAKKPGNAGRAKDDRKMDTQ